MLISDPLYGELEIDGLLEELIVSKPVQRLKEIHQAGAGFLVNSRWQAYYMMCPIPLFPMW